MFKILKAAILLVTMPVAAGAQERQWSLDIGDPDAYLVFGVPETDDIGVSFWCTIKSGNIKFLLPEAALSPESGKTVRFRISTEQMTSRFKGKVSRNEEAGAASLEALIPARHPIFGALQGADRFKVTVGSDMTVFPLTDADVKGLLAVCRKP